MGFDVEQSPCWQPNLVVDDLLLEDEARSFIQGNKTQLDVETRFELGLNAAHLTVVLIDPQRARQVLGRFFCDTVCVDFRIAEKVEGDHRTAVHHHAALVAEVLDREQPGNADLMPAIGRVPRRRGFGFLDLARDARQFFLLIRAGQQCAVFSHELLNYMPIHEKDVELAPLFFFHAAARVELPDCLELPVCIAFPRFVELQLMQPNLLQKHGDGRQRLLGRLRRGLE